MEYVVTSRGAYVYNRSGILNPEFPYTLEEYIRLLNEAREKSRKQDQVRARSLLNEFIRQMDLYNEAGGEQKISFRREETVPAIPDALYLSPEQFAATCSASRIIAV